MSKQLKVVSVIGFVFGVLFAQAQAALITYYIEENQFGDYGKVLGSFDYDTETNSIVNVSITTTAGDADHDPGTVGPGMTYTSQISSYVGTVLLTFTDFDYVATREDGWWDYTGATFLNFYHEDQGYYDNEFYQLGIDAVIPVVLMSEMKCGDAYCSDENIVFIRGAHSGRLVTYDPAIAPLPGALALFLSGLAGLGFAKRRKRVAID